MQNSKVVALLKTFSKREGKLLEKYIRSPFFNTNPTMVLFLKYLQKSAPDFKGRRLERKKAYIALFPNEPFKEIKIQQYMSDLVGLVEAFWVHQAAKRKDVEKYLTIAEQYRKRNLAHYWKKNMEVAADKIAHSAPETTIFCYQQLQIDTALHQAIEAEGQRDQEPNLQQVSDSLDAFYIVSKLKYYCKALNYQRFKTTSYDLQMIVEILAQVERKPYPHIPAIRIYYHAVQTLLDPKAEAHFNQLKKLLHQHSAQLHPTEVQDMFVLARNYCIQQLNTGNKAYLREIFDLYKIEIANYTPAQAEKLPPSTYKNIATVALLLKEHQWLENFIYTFKNTVTEPLFTFNLASLRFSQKRFEEVVELLQPTEYEEVLLHLSVKSLLLKTYFELEQENPHDFDYEDRLDLYITSFTAFLNRKKEQLTKHYIYYLNLTRYLRELLKWGRSLEKTNAKLQQLNESITATTKIAEKVWLQEKVQALLAK